MEYNISDLNREEYDEIIESYINNGRMLSRAMQMSLIVIWTVIIVVGKLPVLCPDANGLKLS